MKRTGILTIHRYGNWGSVLQAYALRKYLRQMGLKAEIIDYLDPSFTKDKMNYLFRQEMKKHKSPVSCIKTLLSYPKFYRKNISWIRAFGEFKVRFLPMTKECRSTEDISRLDLENVVLGSDQIWGKPRKVYFGVGIRAENIISYSASMPREKFQKFSHKDKEKIREYLKGLSAVAVREESGVEFLSALTDKKVHNTADPVFLLKKEDYRPVIERSKVNIKEKYILLYLLYSVKENQLLADLAKELQKKYGYKIINISVNEQKIENCENIGNIGPCECLYLIENAEYVLTNSFHGSALSMVFEKNFYAFAYREPDRLYNILSKAGLEDRLVSDLEKVNFNSIDYEKVWADLNPLIQYSKEYLKNSLKGIQD